MAINRRKYAPKRLFRTSGDGVYAHSSNRQNVRANRSKEFLEWNARTIAIKHRIHEKTIVFCREFIGGQIYLTQGVAALSQSERRAVITALREFDDFSADNDSILDGSYRFANEQGEHDFGAFTVAKQKYFFKISYYDKSLEYGSPDPSDPALTTRALTLMFAKEY
jgi:Protein of unknown function (DUF3768)